MARKKEVPVRYNITKNKFTVPKEQREYWEKLWPGKDITGEIERGSKILAKCPAERKEFVKRSPKNFIECRFYQIFGEPQTTPPKTFEELLFHIKRCPSVVWEMYSGEIDRDQARKDFLRLSRVYYKLGGEPFEKTGNHFNDLIRLMQLCREQAEPPDDLMTLTVAVTKFRVSTRTLRRVAEDEDDKRLVDYRDKAKAENSPILVSKREVERHWPRK